MDVQISIDDIPVNDLLNAFISFIEAGTIFNDAGAFAVKRIVERTKSGLDMNDAPFVSYSPSYDKSPPVNLFVTGDMLGSIDYEVVDSDITVTCDSDIASYHQDGTSNMPQRQFMGLTDKDEEDMLEAAFFAPLNSYLG